MKSLRIIYDIDGWAYHRNALGLLKHAPSDFAVSLGATGPRGHPAAALGEKPDDVIFALPAVSLHKLRAELQQRGWKSKVAGCWSVGLPNRLALFQQLYEEADAWIFSNEDYREGIGRLPGTAAIPFGVDREIFRVTRPIQSRRPRVLWVGSEYFRRVKGYDRLVLPIAARLERNGIDVDLHLVDSYGASVRSAEDMADWYNHGTVLLCASETEGTPNPALEAAACGCTVVSTPVGNMPQLIRNGINGYLAERTVESLYRAVRQAIEQYETLATAMQEEITEWGWDRMAPRFYDVFRALPVLPTDSSGATANGRRTTPKRDLRDQVTVFVTSVGAPTFETCLRRLQQQDCSLRLEVIRNVAPMHAAFQRMLDGCETTFFVQVDEDMLLFPHAISSLFDTISAAPADVAMYCADLYDAHLGRNLHGVKIFRHAVARRYPFGPEDSFEVRQLERMERDGWRYLAAATDGRLPQHGRTLGLHGVHWTSTSVYERYMTLMRRRISRPAKMAWFDEQPAKFLQQFLNDPSDETFFALLGTIAGALAQRDEEPSSKDFRTYGELPGFAELEAFLRKMRG